MCAFRGGDTLNKTTATSANMLLEHACKQQSSDIHFYPDPIHDETKIYYRILGKRKYIKTIKQAFYQVILTYFKFASNMDIGESRRPQNGILSFESKHKEQYSLRLSTLPLSNQESLTIRILPQEKNPTLEKLFLFPTQFKKMKTWLRQSSGIILLTGPTGCGKSTTMYALLEAMLKENTVQAITLEDPIERKLNEVLQVEVNEKAGVSYQTGLKAALRHDPDILMIGEIRDEQTAEFAFQASLTGHLVLSTLHAKDTVGTIDRLIDLGIKRVDIEQSLIAVAAIRLLPIERMKKIQQRAAIVELLEGMHLKKIIKGENNNMKHHPHTFQRLMEKAYVYGFISKETYNEFS